MCRALVCTLVFLLVGYSRLNPATATDAPPAAAPAEVAMQTAEAWPMFRGNPLATGVAVSDLPQQLEVLWRYEVPNGAFEGTPAIVDGVVYLGDLDGTLFALDLSSGRELWKYTSQIGFPTSPSVRRRAGLHRRLRRSISLRRRPEWPALVDL